jgi:serine/threonine protein kinase
VLLDMGMVQHLIDHPQLEMGVDYRRWWPDIEGTVVLMDEYQATLRRWIIPGQPWFEQHWMIVMAGIAMRLAQAHSLNIVHGDLKPSNSFFQSSGFLTG